MQLKAVGESVQKPLEYYRNNITGTPDTYGCCETEPGLRISYSAHPQLYTEVRRRCRSTRSARRDRSTNPYGWTKIHDGTDHMTDVQGQSIYECYSSSLLQPGRSTTKVDVSERIQANPEQPDAIYFHRWRRKALKTSAYSGDDYDTPDGTGVRDYISM